MTIYIWNDIYLYQCVENLQKSCDKDVHLFYRDTLFTSLATCIRILHQKVLQRLFHGFI